MEPLNLREIADAVNGRLVWDKAPPPEAPKQFHVQFKEESIHQTLINHVSIDSRTVQPGTLFIAFPGEKTDGHLYIEEAFRRGATACMISQHHLDTRGPTVIVDDTYQALMALATWYRRKINVPIIGITGSNGKSTTKELTAHLLSSHGTVLKAPKSYNNEIGVPLTLLSWEKHHEVVVLELAMRGKGQIKQLCDIAQPQVGLITSIGDAHIGLLGSQKNIADAKGELLDALPIDGLAFLNGENFWTTYLKDRPKCPLRIYGFNKNHWIFAKDIEMNWSGTKATIMTPLGKIDVTIPLLGQHNLLNFLGATSIALSLGVPLMKIADAASSYQALEGRFNLQDGKNQIKILDDSYNANSASLEAALQTAALLPVEGRRVLVLGDMLELGSFSEESHRSVGEKLVFLGFDALFAIGEWSGFAVTEAKKSGLRFAKHYDTHEALLKDLESYIQTNDLLLVKGSRKMQMERIISPFLS